MGFLDKMRDLVSPTASQAPVARATGNPSIGDDARDEALEVSFKDPGPDAVTCPIRFDRAVSPGGTSLFETPHEAAAWPAVKALLGIPGVHSVIGKGDVLVVARRDSASWPELLAQVQPALIAAFSDVSVPTTTKRDISRPMSPEERDLRARIQDVIDRDINPAVADHGGVITLLDVKDTRVFIHMGGGCQGCSMSTATLKQGVETMLRAQVPEISEILDTTDHAAGANPYFQS
jgi:Fe-S cluster biogenesis protein NfuA